MSLIGHCFLIHVQWERDRSGNYPRVWFENSCEGTCELLWEHSREISNLNLVLELRVARRSFYKEVQCLV